MATLSKRNKAIIEAKSLGYTMTKKGEFFNPKGKRIKGSIQCSLTQPYIRTRIGKKTTPFMFHRFQAYLKFGDKLFEKGIEVRHLDGNSLNNAWGNIALGTSQENSFDICAKTRKRVAQHAANHKKIFTDKEVREIRKRAIEGPVALAAEFSERLGRKVYKSTMSEIISRKIYKSVK